MKRRVVAVLFLLALAAAPLHAGPEPRGVLGLFDSKGRRDELASEDPVHQLLEMPLNHLGLVVRRHDIRRGPPPAEWLESTRAVVTFFAATDRAPDWLWPWLERETGDRGWRVVHFGEFGPLARDRARLARWLARFGLEDDARFVRGPVGVEVGFYDEPLCTFEADPRVHAVHRGPKNLSDRNRAWVSTRTLDHPGDVRVPVVTGPWGGIALDPWAASSGGEYLDRRWYVDPFAFFRDALGTGDLPAPQPQMLNGTRMLVVHVDGDGFESLSTVRRGELCGKVMFDEVFSRYALPFTVSVIVRSLTEDYETKQSTPAMGIARGIFSLPNVEAASHGVLHPLRWDVEKNWYPSLRHYAYSPLAEVKASVRFINERLAPKGRRCRMMLWSGESNPPERVVLAAGETGCLNLNGGVFRWDRWHDSVGFVSPWGSLVGDAVQVYAGAANENDFAGFFRTMPGAFAHIDQTIERTGSPRVLKPADIYCHFYSGERPARLAALRRLLEHWSRERETAPVFASTYARAVVDAMRYARIERTDRGWRFADFGGCRTVRLDGEARDIDWAASRGLLGARRLHGSLYLHLAAGNAEVAFGDGLAAWPHVERANCLLEKAVLSPTAVSVVATAHNPRVVVFAGLAPGGELETRVDNTPAKQRADENGRLAVTLPSPGTTRLEVRLSAARAGR